MVEITDRESLKAWLETRPRADAVLIAARAALRVLPLVVRALDNDAERRRRTVVLPTFRAAAVAGFAGTWPEQATADVRRAARAAADAAASAARAAYAAIQADADAAVRAAYAARAVQAVRAARAARAAADAAYAAAYAAAAATGTYAAYADAVYAAIQADAAALEDGADHADVAARPLWPRGTPDWAQADWHDLSDRLAAADRDSGEGWQVWIDWYRARLQGVPVDHLRDPATMPRQRAIVLIDDDIWDQGPVTVNAEIARLNTERPVVRSFIRRSPQPRAQFRPVHGAATGDSETAQPSSGPSEQAPEAPSGEPQSPESAPGLLSAPDLPVPPTIAFFSYTRIDDRLTSGLVSAIRHELEDAIAFYNGKRLEVFQDVADIEGGDIWRERLERALAEATIFLPIVTPSFFNSKHCREELRRFLARDDAPTIVFPIKLLDTSYAVDAACDELAAEIFKRQGLDWQNYNSRRTVSQGLRTDIYKAAEEILKRSRATR